MRIALNLLLCAMIVSGIAVAGDSPQFRGPNRTGVFDESGLMKVWPPEGPPLLWTATGLGRGFSSVSVVGGKIYATGMNDAEDGTLFVIGTDGAILQRIVYGKETVEKQAPGPRSTPTLDGSRAYLLSGLGVLYCIDVATGAIVWSVDVLARFGAENSTWNIAESVLIDGDRVICTPGGPQASCVALNKATGETVWAALGPGDATSYCSPIIADHNGRRVLLAETTQHILGIDPDTGSLFWSYEHKVPWDIHAVTPVYHGGLVYFSTGEGTGGGALEMAPDARSVTLKWTDTLIDNLHHGVVQLDGYLYGTGHKSRKLACLEMATGKPMWSTDEIGEGVTVSADGMLIIYEGPKKGVVSLVKAVPGGYERTGSFEVTAGDGKHWAHPVLSNGALYIRHGDALVAYQIGKAL